MLKLSSLIRELQALQSMFGDVQVGFFADDDSIQDPMPTLVVRKFRETSTKFISLNSKGDD